MTELTFLAYPQASSVAEAAAASRDVATANQGSCEANLTEASDAIADQGLCEPSITEAFEEAPIADQVSCEPSIPEASEEALMVDQGLCEASIPEASEEALMVDQGLCEANIPEASEDASMVDQGLCEPAEEAPMIDQVSSEANIEEAPAIKEAKLCTDTEPESSHEEDTKYYSASPDKTAVLQRKDKLRPSVLEDLKPISPQEQNKLAQPRKRTARTRRMMRRGAVKTRPDVAGEGAEAPVEVVGVGVVVGARTTRPASSRLRSRIGSEKLRILLPPAKPRLARRMMRFRSQQSLGPNPKPSRRRQLRRIVTRTKQ